MTHRNQKTNASTYVLIFLFAFGAVTAMAQDKATTEPKHHNVAKPISSISIRVMPNDAYERKAAQLHAATGARFVISSSDIDSCVVWISTNDKNVGEAEVQGYKACRLAIDGAVDGAHGKAERQTQLPASLPACTSEDGSTGPSPCIWDCQTMGNGKCRKGTSRYTIIRKQ